MRATALAVTVSLCGCGLPLADEATSVSNLCSTNADCGAGSVCANVGATRVCVATKASLENVQLEVRTDPSSGASTDYLLDLTSQNAKLDGARSSGFVVDFDPKLPEIVDISQGLVQVPPDPTAMQPVFYPCTQKYIPDPSDPTSEIDSTLAKVEFQPVTPFASVLTDSYVAQSTLASDKPLYAYTLAVPAGDYDVYVTPIAPDQCDSLPPPPILLRIPIHKDTDVNVTLAMPKRLTGTLAVPSDTGATGLEGWTLDLVDREQGRPVSTARVLPSPHIDPTDSTRMIVDLYDETDPNNRIDFYPPSNGAPVLRLQPPEMQAGPVVYWQLDNIDIVNSDTDVALNLEDLQLQPVPPEGITGRVISKRDGSPVVASVTFVSKALTGSAAQNATYTVTTQSDTDGYFNVSLIPGSYRAVARPTLDDGNAMVVETEQKWRIDADTQCCGRTIELPPKIPIVGSAMTPLGDPVALANVAATPSIAPSSLYLTNRYDTDFLPRDVTEVIASDGSFSMGVDPGSFDFFVRPEAASTFPWIVRPRLTVDAAAPSVDVGTLSTQFPVALVGTIRAADGTPVPNAIVRAWLPLPAAMGTGADGLIQVVPIAEVTSGLDGSYVLALPPNVTLASP